jgi:hypothetical protein
MDASFLLSIILGVFIAAFNFAARIPSTGSRYEFLTWCLWIAIALAILALAVAAYWLHSSIASLVLGITYLLLLLPQLRLLIETPGNSRDFLITMTFLTPPIAACITAAVAHFLWSHRLRAWKRASRATLISTM